MSNFNFSDRSRGGRDSSRGGFGGGDRRRTEMHDAVCDECGNDCKVPFRPSGDKPIYCSNCFEGKATRDRDRSPRGGGRRDFGRDRDNRRPSSGASVDAKSIEKLTQNIEVLNKKLNTIIELMSSKKGVTAVESKPKKEKKAKKPAKPKKEKKADPVEILIEEKKEE
jgi:CxxC-x17-CxxC domain-containing protein